MSQVHPEFVPLTELVESSSHILVVRPLDPPRREELVSILPPGSAFEGRNVPPYDDDGEYTPGGVPRLDKNYPPYSRWWTRLEVLEVIRGDDQAAPGRPIEVLPAEDAMMRDVHIAYYVHGIGESPIVPSYQPSERPGPGDDHIVFLCAGRDGFTFALEGAVEVLAQREAVTRLAADA